MKHLFTLATLVLLIPFAHGQKTIPIPKLEHKNSIQLELGGHGLFYSLNYERVLISGARFKTTGQIGIAYYPPSSGVINVWVPVSINEMLSFGNHHVEIGLGHVFTDEPGGAFETVGTRHPLGGLLIGRAGYRYQKPGRPFFFRVGFTPFKEYIGSSCYTFWPSGGLAFGYGF